MTKLLTRIAAAALTVAIAAPGAHAADARDRTIVPGQRVGAVTAKSTLAELQRIYGVRNVRAARVHVGEGQYVPGLMLFPGTRAEVEFRMAPGGKRLAWAVIARPKSPWRTKSGIRVGITGAAIEKMNGKPFTLYGFGWDYSGRLAGWLGGALPKSLVPDFQPTAKLPELERLKILGDGKFSSANPVMRRAKIVVYRLLIGL